MRQSDDFPALSRPPLLARPLPAFLFVLAAVVVAVSAAHSAARARQDRQHRTTGAAQWIWWTHDLEEPAPIRFYAVTSFALAAVPASAQARIFADGRWELTVNGERLAVGEQKPGDRLRRFNAAGRLRAGENRVVVAAESRTGAGGILFCLDLPGRPNAVVSDGSWRVTRSETEARSGRGRPAAVWGEPPMHPWGYP